jgi:hypothetical protein
VSCGIFVIALGQYYRHFRGDAGIAMAATAAGLFIIFTMVGSIFNYMLPPIRAAPIDPWLVWIDAHFGYDWQTFIIWPSQYPAVGTILRIVYITSLPLLVAAILILGLSRRQRDLHRFSHDGSHRSDTGNPVLVFLSIVWSIVDLSASVKRTRCRADCGRTGLRCGIETAGPGRRRLPHASQCPGADRLSVVPHSYGLHVGHLSRSCPSAGRSRPCPV